MPPVSIEHRPQQERDLYRKCLELARCRDPTPLLTDALELLRSLADAGRGYIEIEDIASRGAQRWAVSAGLDATERRLIEGQISRGVIAEAIESGETIHTASALLDERFRDRESVRQASIETVLCVPLRADGVVGVVYLQNRGAGGPFADDDVICVEVVARFVGSLAEQLLELMRRRQAEDKTVEVRARLRADSVIGRSAAIATLLGRMELVAKMDSNVLFTGANGTGKSMFARILHENSPRARGPFVEVNCATLPEGLAESELFGAERGAHSGVTQRGIEGKVAAAEKGTLFLDEIGELPPPVQAKLLQLVQDKAYFRLGGTRPVRADVRIVTATNRDLEQAVTERTFREDLFYRIRGMSLEVPRLADRREDISLLARHFVEACCQRNGLANVVLTPATLTALEIADWPGNVRQLAARCEEAVVNAHLDHSNRIDVHHMFPTAGRPDDPGATASFHGARLEWERSFIDVALRAGDWNVAATAKELDISRAHLHALIKRHGLRRDV